MQDAFTRLIAQADSRGAFLGDQDFERLNSLVSNGLKRMDSVNRLTSNASKIVMEAARALFAQQPSLIAPGGNAYTNRRMAACLRDMEIILRYITYSTMAGDGSVLEDRCLNGLRETYIALGVPAASVADGIADMKKVALNIVMDPANITAGDCSALQSEIASYFDKAAAAIV
ncbi:MAG: phycocyanin subunit beta [Synechococcaceae cyanobacterium SM2_3_1]|nr:phycocyanin subunit beta [Synechococcaceae cyanobacterium SM2_3_1]